MSTIPSSAATATGAAATATTVTVTAPTDDKDKTKPSTPPTAADAGDDINEADDKDLAEFGDIVKQVKGLGVGISSLASPGVAAITASPSFGPKGVPRPAGSPMIDASGAPVNAPSDLTSVLGAPAIGKDSKSGSPSKDAKPDDGKSVPSAAQAAADGKEGAAALASGSVATGDGDSDEDKKGASGELSAISDIPMGKEKKFFDVRVAVVGNVDSGKSTLVGVLTGGQLDNGRGLARSRIFVHQHEQANGRTSCISQHIMGFDGKSNAVYQSQPASASSAQKTKSWKAVVSASRSLVTFIDLAGHERYLKTTIAGLTGCFPDYAIVIINSLAGISKMTREHLGVILALEIPFACIVSKIDMCPANVMERTKNQLFRILKSQHAKKLPITVRDDKDIATCLDNNQSMRICPVFLCSSVSGKGMDLLIKYLGGLRPRRDWQITRKDKLTEFHIDETFNVTGVGIVISGTVSSGTLTENSVLMMGPDDNGAFKEVQVKTIHCKRVAVDKCDAGDSCAISLRATKRREPLKRSGIRRGMVLVDPSIKPVAARNFEAEVLVLHHPTTIKMSYQAVIHCGIIRQTAAITNISKDCLRTGDKALVSFRFMIRPEYLHLGSVFIFREGNTKGIGKISKIIFEDDPALAALNNGVTPPKKRERDGKDNDEDDANANADDDDANADDADDDAGDSKTAAAAAATATAATTKPAGKSTASATATATAPAPAATAAADKKPTASTAASDKTDSKPDKDKGKGKPDKPATKK